MGIKRFQTAKVTLKVIQDHWQWCYSIDHFKNYKDIIKAKFKQVAQLPLISPHDALHHGKGQNFKTVT